MKGIITGFAAGIAGAGIWAIIVVLTGFEIGWIAWGIGGVVGAAVAWGSKGSFAAGGVIAVIITIVAIVGGKLATVEIVLGKDVKDINQTTAQIIQDDDYMISWIVTDIIYNMTQEGKKIDWPEGVDPENITSKADYPTEIWATAEESWNAGTDKKKADYRKVIEKQIEANVQLYTTETRKAGFLGSFGAIDIFFFVIAIGTAYKIASKADVQLESEHRPLEETDVVCESFEKLQEERKETAESKNQLAGSPQD